MKKALFIVFVLFLFACSGGNKTNDGVENNNDKTNITNDETKQIIEIIGTGFTAEFPNDFEYNQSMNTVARNNECAVIFLYAPATPFPDSELAKYFVENIIDFTVTDLTEKEYWI